MRVQIAGVEEARCILDQIKVKVDLLLGHFLEGLLVDGQIDRNGP
jgi:hypothetical protein